MYISCLEQYEDLRQMESATIVLLDGLVTLAVLVAQMRG